ncbi:HTR-like protein [Halorubrum sp. DM2]|uniref:hybrid sensor histidine kinase/response regulator n=1 Tax=Halorubrum sp. DM2 TaxID=2527867 RepID=UPI0024B65D03|nr:ATP-binding protein [Halorubrum sp. DM2]VTT87419.1 HTR-like protein [Halorubrum sp. DM2]
MSIEDPQEAATAPVEVLHVDDDPSVLDLTESFLDAELDGVAVTTTTEPEGVIDHLAAGTFHCVISDYDMPGRDGLEVLCDVRDEYPDLPFILYTGKGSEEIAAEAINAGVTGYLQKGGPDQIRRLANRVEHAAVEYRSQIESERYSTVLKALDYPIYVVNEDAEFEYVNEPFVDLTGYDREEIIGSSPGLIKTESDVKKANEKLAEIVSSTGPERRKFSVDIRSKDGKEIPCYDHMAALPFDEEFRGSVGILRDASEEQRRREELLRQNERLEEFTSVVSHDLRTPLNNAEAAAELARLDGDEEHFDRLASEHERMEQMIRDLLRLARNGRTVSETEPVDVGAVASEAWKSFGCPTDELELPDGELVVEGDSARVRQLIENLLRNAVDHGQSPVTVRVREHAGGFHVEDDGPGIDEDMVDAVFEPGFTTASDGTGFGLTIVKRIADAHGWAVDVTESDAGGARFEFAVDAKANASLEEPHVV